VDIDRVMQRLNPAVAWLLRSPMHRLLDWGLMLVTVTGRRSGRVYTIPVGYQRDGDALVVLVSKPSRKQWWRNYRDRRPIGVWLRGRAMRGHAVVVAPGSPAFRDAVERTLRQVPGLGRIPVLGWLFKSREISTDGQELIVIITPTVLPMSVATAR